MHDATITLMPVVCIQLRKSTLPQRLALALRKTENKNLNTQLADLLEVHAQILSDNRSFEDVKARLVAERHAAEQEAQDAQAQAQSAQHEVRELLKEVATLRGLRVRS